MLYITNQRRGKCDKIKQKVALIFRVNHMGDREGKFLNFSNFIIDES